MAGSERVVPVDGVDGRLDPGTRHWRRAGRVNRVPAAGEPNGRVAHAVHHELLGRPPFQAHEEEQRDSLQQDGLHSITRVRNDDNLKKNICVVYEKENDSSQEVLKL